MIYLRQIYKEHLKQDTLQEYDDLNLMAPRVFRGTTKTRREQLNSFYNLIHLLVLNFARQSTPSKVFRVINIEKESSLEQRISFDSKKMEAFCAISIIRYRGQEVWEMVILSV